ncbi:polysaccharide lyase family 1 protein [Macroventuria anomochaeta]|uniref:Polysaccharide lyase family 1 protein n=1 Tax=Macroventuria anomochaeta TaxID=301207 RepID=A0ACB6S630_9PLEO|nr:polysaccharide lyase family 1 protein [Macroventuria anomochaeta]KAF2629509.1 polysaccharide lyase family 1 protein [Macroventuria anomochaeta]
MQAYSFTNGSRFARVGCVFIVSQNGGGSRITISENEFDGVTTTSATCNGTHYWGAMLYTNVDQLTLDHNWFHDPSGRAPKLSTDSVSGTFHAVNTYFENMKGHVFDARSGVKALTEGNVF